MKILLVAAVASLTLGVSAHLGARTLSFAGTFRNTNPPAAAGGRCAALTVTIGNFGPFYATGTSNFGSFTGSQSHCLGSGPPLAVGASAVPYTDGRFTFTFATGDTLRGTYSGLLTNAGSFGVVTNVQDFAVLGGTGRYAAASGSLVGTGQLRFTPGAPPSATLTIARADLTVASVPDAATWTLLIAGFGATGVSLRRRRLPPTALA